MEKNQTLEFERNSERLQLMKVRGMNVAFTY